MDESNSINPESDWASRRKNIYLGAIVLLLSTVSFIIFWQFWYSTPTCFDNFKNGDETGVDCGGSCSLLCSASAIKPVVRWDPRLFEVSPGLWSVLIYVENPNIDATASYVPYTFVIYDQGNNILVTRKGATILPKNKTVGIFEGGISIAEGARPKRAVFELGNGIVWKKEQVPDSGLVITHGPLLKLDSAPRVETNVKNEGIYDIQNVELVMAIFDGSDNVIAASRTFVEKLRKNEDTNILFTWPKPFDLGLKTCEKPSDVVLAIDRSGSMASLSKNPPEPLSSVKNAASFFVSELGGKDRAGVVTFASFAENTSKYLLTNDFEGLKNTITNISILNNGVQYTNIADALENSRGFFIDKSTIDSQKIIVLLTDGVATRPENPKGSNSEAEEIAYAENVAVDAATQVKKEGISIYTIGLGKDIHNEFLKTVASSPDKFFQTPSTSTLSEVYGQISNSICKEVPARIEITYKIFGSSI